ncbi:MAG: hypothetical protein KKE77_00215 [Alphaproteobacteria bacterium]|nr:hypothetical protein [Alphaproteobacteria bacterium]
MISASRTLLALILSSLFLALAPGSATAQETVVVAELPPYAKQQPDGRWTGPAIDLYRAAADRAGQDYRFVAAGPDTGEPEFPVYATPDMPAPAMRSLPLHADSIGLIGIGAGSGFTMGLLGLFTPGFFKTVAIFALLVLIAGTIFWLVERKGNDEVLADGSKRRGIGQGFWWAGVTATTIGYGDLVPRTTGGRIVAMIWMLFSMALTAVLTAYLVSLTGQQGGNRSLSDALAGKHIGIVAEGPVARSDLSGADRVVQFATLDAALAAFDEGRIDAIAYPFQPAREAAGDRSVSATDGSIALPVFRVSSDQLREELDRAILSSEWQERAEQAFSR